jgi:hypothetical protein
MPVLTGGYASVLSPELGHPHTYDPMLTMKGIRYLYLLNQ